MIDSVCRKLLYAAMRTYWYLVQYIYIQSITVPISLASLMFRNDCVYRTQHCSIARDCYYVHIQVLALYNVESV